MLKRVARGILVGLALLGIAWLESPKPPTGQPPKQSSETQKSEKADDKDRASLSGTVIAYLAPIGHAIHDYRDEITAFSTAIIAVFSRQYSAFLLSSCRNPLALPPVPPKNPPMASWTPNGLT